MKYLVLALLLMFSIADVSAVDACFGEPSGTHFGVSTHENSGPHSDQGGCDLDCAPTHCHFSHCGLLDPELKTGFASFYFQNNFFLSTFLLKNFQGQVFRPPIA